MHKWESQHQASLTPARRGPVPFVVGSGGNHKAQLLGLEPLRRCLCPQNRSEILVCFSMTAHRAPFHSAMSPGAHRAVTRDACGSGEPLSSVFPGSCHSAIAVCIRSQAAVGSSSSLLMAVPLSLLPGDRAGADFPLLMHSLLCRLGSPLTSSLLQAVFNSALKSKQHRQIDWDVSWLKGYLGHITWKNWFASPCREKLIYLGVQHAGHPPLPAHPHRQTGPDCILLPPSWFLPASTLLLLTAVYTGHGYSTQTKPTATLSPEGTSPNAHC